MRRIIFLLVLSAGLIATAACGGDGAIDPTATALFTPTSTPTEVQDVTFTELFASPDQYNGRDILLEGFYFDGWETTVLSETLEHSGRAEGHLWPQGQMIWIEGSIPEEVYDQLSQQELIGPIERYGKLRIGGRFEYGARYGHVGGFTSQIIPSAVELLPWSPPPTPTASPTASVTREWNLEGIQVDGSTVTVLLYVFAGIDVRVTLDGRIYDQFNSPVPILEFVFENVDPGKHTIEMKDVVGFREAAEVVVSADSIKKPNADGLCVPAAPLGVSVGDNWTISGTVVITGSFPSEGIPQGATGQSTSFTVTAIEDSTIGGSRSTEPVKYQKVQGQSTHTWTDADGNVLSSEDEASSGVSISVNNQSPVLTLDWDCHEAAWLNSWQSPDEATVERLTLSTGVTVVVFSVMQAFDIPTQGIEMTVERGIGYDVQTGRLVYSESRTAGTANGEPFTVEFLDTLELDDTAWLIDLINSQKNEPVANPPAFIAQYEYKGQTVYFLPQRCCDIFSDLYDSDGNIIGHPDGGIAGQGDGRVSDFLKERNSESVIWRDQRTYDSGLIQALAPIESVEVLIMESFPPQYSLTVVSGLPNGCAFFAGYRLERSGYTIRVEMVNWKPADRQVVCTENYLTVETWISLGSDFESGKEYSVVVNDVTETFVAQ